jgi:hypothetical protein
VPADDGIEEKWKKRLVGSSLGLPHIQDFDFQAMKPNALYSISLRSPSTLTKQLINFFLLEQFFFEKFEIFIIFVSYNDLL